MSSLIALFIAYLQQLAGVLPLSFFTALGAFIEELLAPIPSPIVMTLAGSLARSQDQAATYLLWLALVGAVGKTFGSYLLFVVVNRSGELFLNKFGRFLGVSAKEVEQIGKHLNKGWRDDVVLIILRALPIMPTAPVSIVCGLININIVTYLRSTFIGTFIRNIFYLYLGYSSMGALESINEGLDGMEVFGYAIFFAMLVFGGVWFIKTKRKGIDTSFLDRWTKKS